MRWLAPALLAALAPAAAAQERVPDVVLTGDITGADHERYKPLSFDVPKGVERITVTLDYDKANKTVIDLGLWDPERFRGWSGGARSRFTLSASDATPGYLPGALPAGKWRVMLGVPNARPNSRAAYRVTVRFDREGRRDASAAIAEPPIRDAPGWYRGDLHMHDANSDGSCASQSGKRVPCPLFRTVEKAAAAGLDFIAVTDHNSTAHFGGLRELQPWFDKMLLIPGIEITTFGGHANIFGPRRFVDFRVGSAAVPDIRALQKDVTAAGAILSINHPALPSGEACMGCGWVWPKTDWSRVTAIEAVNGNIAEGPLAGIGYWYARLNEGHRLTGIAGSDNHDPDAPEGKAPIGRPTTVVHAARLSQPAILAGIAAGNAFIDVTGKGGRMLEVDAEAGGRHVAMGGAIEAASGTVFRAHAVGVADGSAELVVNGVVVRRRRVEGPDARIAFQLDARSCGWAAVNVRDAAKHPLLIGNPIYLTCR
ncbi:CehA/McbA family metallohydrolase [Sphingomonas psychrotolerans]|uniref:Phosphotransferase n=1 Tax=Sphingomonas psychrotolerans TaxID=1327635 RepID=A0A2K8MCI8_9SPHN|nr:CehA/McbA family metallohydrolase [Sphingomonas psychrotolerans]ATY31573.1 phosphotransferase [Sphingomonas psychrotolerans]